MDKVTIAIIALIVIAAALLIVIAIKQPAKVKEWLLFAVMEAEKDLGSGTGPMKLRYVYDLFTAKFPKLSVFISFSTFSEWVDVALEYMEKLLVDNKSIKTLIKE